jgi:hypothetical protein
MRLRPARADADLIRDNWQALAELVGVAPHALRANVRVELAFTGVSWLPSGL